MIHGEYLKRKTKSFMKEKGFDGLYFYGSSRGQINLKIRNNTYSIMISRVVASNKHSVKDVYDLTIELKNLVEENKEIFNVLKRHYDKYQYAPRSRDYDISHPGFLDRKPVSFTINLGKTGVIAIDSSMRIISYSSKSTRDRLDTVTVPDKAKDDIKRYVADYQNYIESLDNVRELVIGLQIFLINVGVL